MTGLDVVVLAGGNSTRMGTDKAVMQVDGVRLVDRVVAAVQGLGGQVVVAAGRRQLEVAGARCVLDPPGQRGPLAGIAAAMPETATDLVAVVAVDLPAASATVLAGLAELAQLRDADAAVPIQDGHPQVLHAVYHRRLLPRLVEVIEHGHGSLRRLLDDLDVVRVAPDTWAAWDPGGGFGRDWDRPADLPDTVRRQAGLETP